MTSHPDRTVDRRRLRRRGVGTAVITMANAATLRGQGTVGIGVARELAVRPELLLADDVPLHVVTEVALWVGPRARGITVLEVSSKCEGLAQADRVVVLVDSEEALIGPGTELSLALGTPRGPSLLS